MACFFFQIGVFTETNATVNETICKFVPEVGSNEDEAHIVLVGVGADLPLALISVGTDLFKYMSGEKIS